MVRLEIAALYAGVNILILLFLSFRVVGARRSHQVVLGDGGNEAVQRAVRAHGNAAEYIPAGIAGVTLLALLDPAAPLWLVHAAGGTLTAGRILHGWGLSTGVLNLGRQIGTVLTWLSFLILGAGLIWAGLAQAL